MSPAEEVFIFVASLEVKSWWTVDDIVFWTLNGADPIPFFYYVPASLEVIN